MSYSPSPDGLVEFPIGLNGFTFYPRRVSEATAEMAIAFSNLRDEFDRMKRRLEAVQKKYIRVRAKMGENTPRLSPINRPEVKLGENDSVNNANIEAETAKTRNLMAQIYALYNERVDFLDSNNADHDFEKMVDANGKYTLANEGAGASSSSSSLVDAARMHLSSMLQGGVDNVLGRNNKRARLEDGDNRKPAAKEAAKGECCICMTVCEIMVSCKGVVNKHHYCKGCLPAHLETCCSSGRVTFSLDTALPCSYAASGDCRADVPIFKSHVSKRHWKMLADAMKASLKLEFNREREAEERAAAEAAALTAAGIERVKRQFDVVVSYGQSSFCPDCHFPGVKEADKCMHIRCLKQGCPGNFCYCCGVNRNGFGGCRCDHDSAFFNARYHPALASRIVLAGENEAQAVQAEFHLLRTAYFLRVFRNLIGLDRWIELLRAYPNLLQRVVWERNLTEQQVAAALEHPIVSTPHARAAVQSTVSRMIRDVVNTA